MSKSVHFDEILWGNIYGKQVSIKQSLILDDEWILCRSCLFKTLERIIYKLNIFIKKSFFIVHFTFHCFKIKKQK